MKNLLIVATACSTLALHGKPSERANHSTLCTTSPGPTLAVVKVDRDTTIALWKLNPYEAPPSPTSVHGEELAVEGTPMPAGYVKLLEVDPATRAELAEHGIKQKQPTVILFAAPYGNDCRTVKWTGPIDFLIKGETGFVRGGLAPRERWPNGIPIIVISEPWEFPYPRRYQMEDPRDSRARLASAHAMYSFQLAVNYDFYTPADSATRASALAWAREHAASAKLEPIRGMILDVLGH